MGAGIVAGLLAWPLSWGALVALTAALAFAIAGALVTWGPARPFRMRFCARTIEVDTGGVVYRASWVAIDQVIEGAAGLWVVWNDGATHFVPRRFLPEGTMARRLPTDVPIVETEDPPPRSRSNFLLVIGVLVVIALIRRWLRGWG